MGVHRAFSRLAAAGLALSLGLFACGGAQPDDVVMSPSYKEAAVPVDDEAPVPQVTALRFTGCAERSAQQGADGRSSNVFHYDVKLNGQGRVSEVHLRGMTSSDAALEECVREAIAAMIVPEGMLHPRSSRPISGGERMTRERRGLVGSSDSENPLIPLGMLIVEEIGVDVIIEVGLGVIAAIGTIVGVGEDDTKKYCQKRYEDCLMTHISDQKGSVHGESLCLWCRQDCVKYGGWPSSVSPDGKRRYSCK